MTTCWFLHFMSSKASSTRSMQTVPPCFSSKVWFECWREWSLQHITVVSIATNQSVFRQPLQCRHKASTTKHFPVVWCKSRSSTAQQHKERRIYYNNHDSSETNTKHMLLQISRDVIYVIYFCAWVTAYYQTPLFQLYGNHKLALSVSC